MSKVYEIDGRRWIKISEVGRLLKTNAVGIRAMRGDGDQGRAVSDFNQPGERVAAASQADETLF